MKLRRNDVDDWHGTTTAILRRNPPCDALIGVGRPSDVESALANLHPTGAGSRIGQHRKCVWRPLKSDGV